MIDAYFVSPETAIAAKGDSQPLDISSSGSRIFLLTLSIMSMVEQESLEVSVFTSEDATTWDAKPAAFISQKFYVGEYPVVVDITSAPNAKFVRAHWEVSRWGRGATAPKFEIALRLREVPLEALHEAQAEAHASR
ncbi:MAG TPA: hypothetical protein VFB04_01830 [Terriglobales bacterium]|nr:hypothetical protein [Terriglobales bacterium]